MNHIHSTPPAPPHRHPQTAQRRTTGADGLETVQIPTETQNATERDRDAPDAMRGKTVDWAGITPHDTKTGRNWKKTETVKPRNPLRRKGLTVENVQSR